jgi:hypothetical protein
VHLVHNGNFGVYQVRVWERIDFKYSYKGWYTKSQWYTYLEDKLLLVIFLWCFITMLHPRVHRAYKNSVV